MTTVQRASAARLIADKGQAITIAYNDGGAYNIGSGTFSGGTPVSVATHATVFPASANRKVAGANMVAGDEMLYISTIDTAGDIVDMPPVDAVVTLADGSTRSIVAIENLSPAGLDIMLTALVRRFQ